jgi:outer membrane protein assembly factor BamB
MNAPHGEPLRAKPLRLWPGLAAVTLLWIVRFILPVVRPEAGGAAILGGMVGGLAVLVWWLLFSRAPWTERFGAIALMIVAVAATSRLVHESIVNGMMEFMLFVYAVPMMSLALVVWATATRGAARGARYASLVTAVLLACGTLTLIRTNGLTGDANSDLEWRWTLTAEDRLLASTALQPTLSTNVPSAAPAPTPSVTNTAPIPPPVDVAAPGFVAATTPSGTGTSWPGFRGANRDSTIRGVRIETDWIRVPPVELWRRPVGPGWSSFAVLGSRIYTQEQRGNDEVVSAYDLNTGAPVWQHRDDARFWESNAGAGPRATPTVVNGRVYTLGGTGILNALDARDGSVVWSRNAVADTEAAIPDWGIASSPLVVGDIVIAATAGSLAAYDVATGKPRWFGPKDGRGYSSPHLSTIDGVEQIVLLNGSGAIGVDVSDGAVLWTYDWPSDGILQPAMIGGDLLIGSGSGLASHTGMSRVAVSHGAEGWSVQERWTSTGLKPYFNDFVVHGGHAFGFDGSILACIDLQEGTRKWKGGRYGHGQLVLLSDQDVLLVLSEDGELVLVKAASDRFTELARVPALSGKTWNHPVLVGNTLLVRNGEEMAAFRLSLVRP